MNEMADPLAELKDIHIPDIPSFWPPAIGWWILIVVCIALLYMCVTFIRKRILLARPKKQALRELQVIESQYYSSDDPNHKNTADQALLNSISELVRRVAIHRYGKEKVAALYGDEWLQFLDRTSGNSDFSSGSGQCLGSDLYQKSPVINAKALTLLVKSWIKHGKSTLTGEQT